MKRTALLLALLCVAAACAWCASNPLAPLTAAEIRQAVRIVNASGRAQPDSRFSIVALSEPAKDAVLKHLATGGAAPARRAFLVVYSYSSNQTAEAVANLSTGALDSWKVVPGAEAPVTGEDSERAIQHCAPRPASGRRPRRPRIARSE